jgi:hypothetical protein
VTFHHGVEVDQTRSEDGEESLEFEGDFHR